MIFSYDTYQASGRRFGNCKAIFGGNLGNEEWVLFLLAVFFKTLILADAIEVVCHELDLPTSRTIHSC